MSAARELCVFTLTSMGRDSAGQSSLRRALPTWFIVQYPVILTSGRGNLKIEGHMVTTAWKELHNFEFLR